VATPASFEEFVRLRYPGLRRSAYHLTHDWSLAEDLVQAALTQAWRVWSRVDESNDPEAYVRKIMYHVFTAWWRRRWNAERPSESPPDHGSSVDEPGRSDDRDEIWRAIVRLPRRQRAAIVLRYFEDMTEAQAAEVLGCSVGTIKSQTSRAIATLRLDPSLRPEGVRQ
jgi:RNA polymerase sigma-70 factor (sigma-E family)